MKLSNWKEYLELNLAERAIFKTMRPEITRAIERWYNAEQALNNNQHPLNIGRFFFDFYAVEEELNFILVRLTKLCDIQQIEAHDLNEKFDFLIELHQSGLPQDINLMKFPLNELLEIKNKLYRGLEFRSALGAGKIKMSSYYRAWPSSQLFRDAESELANLLYWLHELAREVGKAHVQKFGS